MDSIEEQAVFITGATDGLGKQVAKRLTAQGATVFLHGRDSERAEAATREIEKETDPERPSYYLADLSSLQEVSELAGKISSEQDRLDVLINNAGVILPERKQTEDGIELTFAVNYLSHFLLTRLLLPLLQQSAPARIVNVASAGQSPIDFDNVMLEKSYDPMRAYGQSKLAMIMDAFTLAEELEGTGVTANALHPATLMDTKMVLEAFGGAHSNVEEGVRATVRLATASNVEGPTGRYFDGEKEARASRQAYDRSARERLKRLSEELTGL